MQTQLSEKRTWSLAAIEFLREIGIDVVLVDPGQTNIDGTFLPAIRISHGTLVVDLDSVFPGDLLHEAGHLAVIPLHVRHLANDRLEDVFITMQAYLAENGDDLMAFPEDPLCRGILQSEEGEATAWQYAAARAIGLPDEWLFPKDSYQGESKSTLAGLKQSAYIGIHGLQAAGWTLVRKNPRRDTPVYPKLAFWLHPGELPAKKDLHRDTLSISKTLYPAKSSG